uniref:Uncharacterized protein n=1 Tax=Laticauda laticaudata TaxID=8630 RepID=A0A8C5S119_LATLA
LIRPIASVRVVDYSQFQESDDADEEYGRDSAPPAKKIRSSPRDAKNKRRSGKNSQEDSLFRSVIYILDISYFSPSDLQIVRIQFLQSLLIYLSLRPCTILLFISGLTQPYQHLFKSD